MVARPYTASDRARMAKMWMDGMTAKAIGETFGRSRGSVLAFMSANRSMFPKKNRTRVRRQSEAA